MKNLCKKSLKLSLICFLFAVTGCEKDLFDEPIKKSHGIRKEKISFSQMMSEVSDPNILDYLQTLKRSISSVNPNKQTNEEIVYFQKFIKEDEYISYSLKLNDYSEADPYFLELVIKKDSISEKAGFIKYIPDEPTEVLDARDFTGTIEVSNLKNHEVASKYFTNSTPVQAVQSFATSECYSHLELVQHNCTHGGNHAPGEACNGFGGNDGYYELVITQFCIDHQDYNFTAAPDMSMGGYYGGGGGSNLSAEDIAYYNFLRTLNERQTEILANTPGLIDYIMENNVSQQAVNEVTQLINICLSNNVTLTINNPVNGNILTLEDLQDELESNFSVPNNLFETETIPMVNNGFVGRCKIKINTFYGIRIGMNFTTTTNGQYSLAKQNISSDLYGLSAFTQWTQLSSQCTVNNNFNGRIRVELYGKLHQQYTIPPFNGVNINQFIRIILLIDKNTGETISTEWYYD